MIYEAGDFDLILRRLHWRLIEEAPQVNTGHWQGVKGTPHADTRELQYVTFETSIPETKGEAHLLVEPNMPWAEDHFQERVSRDPANPGVQFQHWPWYKPGWEAQEGGTGQFSHTYMERMWPRFANEGATRPNGRQVFVPHNGIRYELGDLDDVVRLLYREPHTRQAYLPMWFPEDTGAKHEGRVPCSLGWHFMVRDGRLNIVYYMRSVDFLRYFRDDVYMTMRLLQWVLLQLQDAEMDDLGHVEASEHGGRFWFPGDIAGDGVQAGSLVMHISSLHVFEGDMGKMRREAPERP